MFEHYSPAAQAIMRAAQGAARAHHAEHLGIEHLLIGLLRSAPDLPLPAGVPAGGGVALAARVADAQVAGAGSDGALKATPGAIAATQRAEALRTERQDAEVTPLHLLVAVLEGLAADPSAAPAVQLLDADLSAWQSTARDALAHQAPTVRTTTPAGTPRVATPNLDRYGRDLTALARQGTLPPLIGREREMRAMIEVLCKMSKNNPALVGEPGVGKTALVEGLAQRMAADKVPFHLRDRRLVALDLNAMVAGTRYRGDFEERLKAVLEETEKSRAVLFLDEMHTMIGAGDSEGGGDVANVLKPYLTHGEISVIGATTTNEYRRYIERDGALERRFQPLTIEEPSPEATLTILTRLRPRFEAHYRATIPDAVLEKVIDLGHQHLRHRYFPDKAIDVLQLACARALLDHLPDPEMVPAVALAATAGTSSPGPEPEPPCVVSGEDVLTVMSDLTGIPA
ncbi:MAG TPA: AAA family ATPase, partial [Chloroflexia bacterium]|nr:AAA family ATPase [Chloroflexia bacterium]